VVARHHGRGDRADRAHPSYATIGIAAPILLVVCRFAQGFGVGGEWGGAVLLAVEHSGGDRRGFHGSWPQMGVPFGLLLSTGIFALLSARMSEQDFLAWGWRVPFLLSVALVAVGLFVRLRVLESPLFVALEEDKATAPLLEVFRGTRARSCSAWACGLRRTCCSTFTRCSFPDTARRRCTTRATSCSAA
jgi:MFS family permease